MENRSKDEAWDKLSRLLTAEAVDEFRRSRPDIRVITGSNRDDWEQAAQEVMGDPTAGTRLVQSTLEADPAVAQREFRQFLAAVDGAMGGNFRLLADTRPGKTKYVEAVCQVVVGGWENSAIFFEALKRVGEEVAGRAGVKKKEWWKRVPVFTNFSDYPGATNILAELAKKIEATKAVAAGAPADVEVHTPANSQQGQDVTKRPTAAVTDQELVQTIEHLHPDTRCLLALIDVIVFDFPFQFTAVYRQIERNASEGQKTISRAIRGLEEPQKTAVNDLLSHIAILRDRGLLELGRRVGFPGGNVAVWITRLYTDLSSLTSVFTPDEIADLSRFFTLHWSTKVLDWEPEYVLDPNNFGPYTAKFFRWLERELKNHGTSLGASGLSSEFLQRVGISLVEEKEFDPASFAF